MKKILISETQLKIILQKYLNEQSVAGLISTPGKETDIEQDVNELDFEGYMGREDLQILRDALDKNVFISVAYVKKDGTVKHMLMKRNIKAYVRSDREKSEKQANIESNNNIKRVVDVNAYKKAFAETGNEELASKKCWRTINLGDVLGFMVRGQFIDLREENEIMQKFGEQVYNSLSRSMLKAIENQAQNA